jgi:hypothetical protein
VRKFLEDRNVDKWGIQEHEQQARARRTIAKWWKARDELARKWFGMV